jgi:hypothetical protein
MEEGNKKGVIIGIIAAIAIIGTQIFTYKFGIILVIPLLILTATILILCSFEYPNAAIQTLASTIIVLCVLGILFWSWYVFVDDMFYGNLPHK